MKVDRIGENLAGVVQNKGLDPGAETVSAAKEAIEQNRDASKRVRKTKEERDRLKKIEAAQDKIDAEVKRLFAPENWEAIVRAPADLALATTGDKVFDMPDKNVKQLAQTGSVAASYFIKTDPKWLALIMFGVNAATIYGGMIAIHLNNRKAAKKAEPSAA